MNQLRETRKEKFLYEFNAQGKYEVMKSRLRKSILRIVQDKYRKTVGVNPLSKEERERFLAELHTYLKQ